MEIAQLLALKAWSEVSNEGILLTDMAGNICIINPCLQKLFKLPFTPTTLTELLRQTQQSLPELRALLEITDNVDRAQWGSLRFQKHPPRRLSWEQKLLYNGDESVGMLTIFRDDMLQGQMEVAKQSFLTMMSHDVRTPLSTILGFSELLYHNRTKLSDEEQNDFLEHIIKNANQLSRYTQIVLDIMFLEANVQSFTVQPVALNEFIKQWMQDALHRFPASQLVFNNGVAQEGPPANTAPAALHKIMYILAEFAIGENPSDESINIQLNYEEDLAHILIHHRAPNLTASDAAVLFRLLHPRDLSESARPHLHRMQLYVASLLAERQQGYLTLRARGDGNYQIDLALPILSSERH